MDYVKRQYESYCCHCKRVSTITITPLSDPERDALRKCEELEAENAELRKAGNEIMSWIANWSPIFCDTDEWPAARDRWLQAAHESEGE